MIQKNFYGNLNEICQETIEDALSCGAVVYYRKCRQGLQGTGKWAKWGTGRDEWQPLKNIEQHDSLNEWVMNDELGWQWVEISYHLTNSQHLLLEAKARQREEECRRWLEADYQAWCERRQQQVEALLKKKPWLEDPHTGFDMARECAEGLVYYRQIAPEAAI